MNLNINNYINKAKIMPFLAKNVFYRQRKLTKRTTKRYIMYSIILRIRCARICQDIPKLSVCTNICIFVFLYKKQRNEIAFFVINVHKHNVNEKYTSCSVL